MIHSINLCAEELARQVKRHRDKRRKRRESRSAAVRGNVSPRPSLSDPHPLLR